MSRHRIERIELFPVFYPTQGYFKFFHSPRGFFGRAAVVVKMTADEGTVGWGQSVPITTWSYETLDTSTIVMRDFWKPVLLDRDPTDLEGANEAMDRALAPAFSMGMPIARAGLDMALHDLAGKLQNKSVFELWEMPRSRKTIQLSWTVNIQSLDEVGRRVEEGKEKGYRNFNIKVSPDVDQDVALAKSVRELAPDTFLWADANGGYPDAETAMQAAKRLADVGTDVLEAPLRPNRLTGYQELKRQGALPIFMDEGVVSPVEVEEFGKLGMIDGIAMKPARCGGLTSAGAQLETIRKREMRWLGSGLTDPDISLVASLALYSAYDLETPAALNGPQFLADDILAVPLELQGDQMTVPNGKGLGIEIDEQKLQEMVEASKNVGGVERP